MNTVFIGIGSNINKEYNLVSCIRALEKHFGKIILSDVYESEAVGFEGDNFYNMVVSIETDYSPQQLEEILRDIEHQHQRVRGAEKFVSRTLDLDQLMYSNRITEDQQLKIPHHEITSHTYILYPLSDIAEDLTHPVLNKSFGELRIALNAKMNGALLKKIQFPDLEKLFPELNSKP